MKKILKLIAVAFVAILIYSFLAVVASAEDTGEQYTVKSGTEGYSVLLGTEEILKGGELSTLLTSLPSGARVYFDGIETDELITLRSGEYTLSGSIRFLSEGGVLVDGAAICHSGLSLSLDNGTVRIRRGEYALVSGYIISNGVALTLDGFASARFVMTGGGVRAASYALYLEEGSANILGGSLSSLARAAVYSSSELVLSGEVSVFGGEYSVACT
ncbi:MAG: hypothetical protein J6Q69_05405, partial [Clostridia bacterium]|nr:hypothetical protein [Clostridia bacterium]